MIIKCTCTHKGQDTLHGAFFRVFNEKLKVSGKPQEYRCTVCGTIKTV